MALGVDCVIEVRTGGHADNGGGFDAVSGTPGTDYSQQDGPQHTYTDLVIGSAGSEDDLTSAAFPFGSDDVGNVLNITGGTGFTTGRYRVVSVSGSVATMDRNVGTADSTGGAGRLGGAVATIQQGHDIIDTADQICYVKAGSGYTITASIAVSFSGGSFDDRTRIVGYTTTRGDKGRAVVTFSGSSISGFNVTASGWSIENFECVGTGQASAEGFQGGASYVHFVNCKSTDMAWFGFDCNQTYNTTIDCEADNCTLTGFSFAQHAYAENCWAHDGTGSSLGFDFGADAHAIRCRATNNGGIGIQLQGFRSRVDHCVCHDNGDSGIEVLSDYPSYIYSISNNILTDNTGYGLEFSAGANPANVLSVRNNAFRGNSSGEILNWTNSTDGKVSLTADPYENAAADDYTLNNTLGGGAECRNAGVNNTDIGYYQHVDAGGGGGVIVSRPKRVM